MKLLTCAHCGAKHNTSDMGYCWKCNKPLSDDAQALLRHVWNHMHGQNMDGSQRLWIDGLDDERAKNWNKLSDAIGEYLSSTQTPVPFAQD